MDYYEKALAIARDIGNVQIQNESREYLAAACLYQKNLSVARAIAEEACDYDYPPNNHNVKTLLGVIALCQGDRVAAQQAFQEAIAHANKILGKKVQLYKALDAKGLALAGLALCDKMERLQEASESFHTARIINKDAGYVKRILHLLELLAVMDKHGILADVRGAARGYNGQNRFQTQKDN